MPATPPIPILFEDDAIVAFDKPSGLCVIPSRHGDPGDCLRRIAEERLGLPLFVVHRIDRETSGVVVMAKTADAHRILNDAFAGRSTGKTYRALVDAVPDPDHGIVDVALHPARRGRMRPALPGERGVAAETRYRVIERAPPSAVEVEFEPVTGRQHQIRVHARCLGSPILGDRLYASRGVRDRAPRLMLHALKLRLPHPIRGQNLEIAAPLPPEFASVRQRLARG